MARSSDGMVHGALFENWKAINSALGQGLRDLPGGSSIARLLAEHRGVRNIHGLGPLSEEQILAWADAHYERTGRRRWGGATFTACPPYPAKRSWPGPTRITRARGVGPRSLRACP